MIDVIKLTQESIRCASVTPEDAGAQEVLKKPLRDMGFEIFDLPFEGNGSYPVQNFFARLGTGGPHFCYCGHADVVPAGDEAAWTYPPFDPIIKDGIMYGRGTSDMKGANAAFITAIAKFLDTHKDFKGSISLIITGDEEADSINGTKRVLEWMEDNNHIPDFCLGGEPTNIQTLGEEIKIGRRGVLSGILTTKGKQGHVAYPQFADNPLPRLCAMGNALSEFEFDKGTEHFSATNLEIYTINVGNKAANIIPAEGTLEFNIRFNTTWSVKTLEQKLREILDGVSQDYELITKDAANPFLTEPCAWTQTVLDIVQTHTNKTPQLSTSGGTSDARFISQYCPVAEFGLTNQSIHQVDENVKVADLEKLVGIYEDIITQSFS